MFNRSSFTRSVRLAIGTAVLASLAASPVVAQKKPPAPPQPPPPSSGTIFFWENASPSGLKAMRWDGSSKVLLPVATAPFETSNLHQRTPSRLVYGPDPALDRIWLAFADTWDETPEGPQFRRELYAYKFVDVGQGTRVTRSCRITKLYPGYQVNNTDNGMPAWSNGGDSFISFPAWQFGSSQQLLLRAKVTSVEIDAAIAAGTNIDLDAAAFNATESNPARLEVVATSHVSSEFIFVSWSPLGDRVAYDLYDWSGPSNMHRFVIRTVATGAEIPLASLTSGGPIEWSPDGARIAFPNILSISTVNPDGTGLATPYPRTSNTDTYHRPYWSPDSTQLVFKRYRADRKTSSLHIERGLATGGSTAILTGDLPSNNKWPIAWVPNP
jgi:hypothetical protein